MLNVLLFIMICIVCIIIYKSNKQTKQLPVYSILIRVWSFAHVAVMNVVAKREVFKLKSSYNIAR